MAGATLVVTTIVERIAAREGIDPSNLEIRLYDVIETNALEAITDGEGRRQPPDDLRVEFTYYGYSVTVDGTGEVTIDDRA